MLDILFCIDRANAVIVISDMAKNIIVSGYLLHLFFFPHSTFQFYSIFSQVSHNVYTIPLGVSSNPLGISPDPLSVYSSPLGISSNL